MAFKLEPHMRFHLKVKAVDADGKDAKVESMTWASSDPTMAVVTPDDDGMGAWIAHGGTPGFPTIEVTGDADLGEGVETITGSFDVEMLGGKAVGFMFEASEPELIP